VPAKLVSPGDLMAPIGDGWVVNEVAQVVVSEGYMVQVATERGTVVVNGEIEVPTRGLGD
jgi:hypothetical protein